MASYTDTACNDCNLQVFQSYNIDKCSFWDGTILGFFLTTCGTEVSCIQDQTEVQALIDQGKAQFVPGLGTLNASTANTIDVPFPCGPSQVVEDYTNTIDYEIPFNDFENYDFWNEIKESGVVGEAYYVIKSGVIFKMSSSPSITADWGVNGQFLTIAGTFTYETTSLDKPYKALGPIFGCSTSL